MAFPEPIEKTYRVVKTSFGEGEFEETIPLGSWKKGGGLAGKKGHVYRYSYGWIGVWLIGRGAKRFAESLRSKAPNLTMMQEGDGEITFRIPDSELEAILPDIKGKRRTVVSEALKNAAQNARLSSPIPSIAKAANDSKAIGRAESTQAENSTRESSE